MPANLHQMRAAETILGLRTHGHHSHGHPPHPSHDPPRLSNGGWYPPGAGPFRPGPGAPSFGARMPMSHRPGITFGPSHRPHYESRGTGWEGRGVYDLSNVSHTPVGIGSRQRWHSVTNMMSGTPVFGAATLTQKLTPVERQSLRQMMIDALRPKTDPGSVAAKLFTRETQGTKAATRLQDLFSKSTAPSAKSDLERILFLGPAAAKAVANYQSQKKAIAVADYAKGMWGTPGPSPQPGGSSDPSLGFDANVNINLPSPSASASLKL